MSQDEKLTNLELDWQIAGRATSWFDHERLLQEAPEYRAWIEDQRKEVLAAIEAKKRQDSIMAAAIEAGKQAMREAIATAEAGGASSAARSNADEKVN